MFDNQEDAFGFIRFRTRRQRILHKLSFETESHNIYDPYYTSEDDESYKSLQDFLKDSEELS